MNTARVTLTVEDHIATVTLNRPDKYNGLDLETLEALVKTARAIRKTGTCGW